MPGDIIILHLYTTNENHIMYGSWDTDHGRQKNVCHFRLFYALLPLEKPRKSKFCKKEKNAWRYHHFTQVYHKCQSYDAWFLRYEAQQTNFFVILSHFCPFTTITTQTIKILKNWKKRLDISSFYTGVPKIMIIGNTVPDTWHMMDCYFSFWAIFCPSTTLTAQKIKILKKMTKIPGDIIILHNCTKNHDHMLYCSWDMTHDRCNCYFSFCAIFSRFLS